MCEQKRFCASILKHSAITNPLARTSDTCSALPTKHKRRMVAQRNSVTALSHCELRSPGTCHTAVSSAKAAGPRGPELARVCLDPRTPGRSHLIPGHCLDHSEHGMIETVLEMTVLMCMFIVVRTCVWLVLRRQWNTRRMCQSAARLSGVCSCWGSPGQPACGRRAHRRPTPRSPPRSPPDGGTCDSIRGSTVQLAAEAVSCHTFDRDCQQRPTNQSRRVSNVVFS